MGINWPEAFRRAVRTFFQTFGASLGGLSLIDAVAKDVLLSTAAYFGAAALNASIAAAVAFSMNVGSSDA